MGIGEGENVIAFLKYQIFKHIGICKQIIIYIRKYQFYRIIRIGSNHA